MITRIEKTLDGEEIKILVPENAEDEAKLRRLALRGDLEDLGSLQEASDREVKESLGY